MRRAMLLIAVAPLLVGCGSVIDSEQLRLCRDIVAALNPDGAEIRELRDVPATLGTVGVRIDYAARVPGEASRVRYVACGFAGRTFSADRLDLTAVETDGGTLGDAQLYFLKRFWLGAAPGAGEGLGGQPAGPILP